MPECTKEELWATLVAYIDHVGNCEGVTFLGTRHIVGLDARVIELLKEAENQV